MRRLHLFEFEDQPWLPRAWRRYLSELLQHQTQEIYRPVVPLLADWLRDCGCREVVDIGSGVGGPWPMLLPALRAQGFELAVTLTDRYPPDFEGYGSPAFRYDPEPLDAIAISKTSGGCRTIFTSLHHLRPAEAEAVLAASARSATPVAVFEFTERTWPRVLGMLLSPILVWVQTPAIPGLDWGRLFWTYALPVVPLLYLWDGLVSHLRSYRPDELRALAPSAPGYRWEVGRLRNDDQGVTITYLLGRRSGRPPRD